MKIDPQRVRRIDPNVSGDPASTTSPPAAVFAGSRRVPELDEEPRPTSLLEKAKRLRGEGRTSDIDDEGLELALGWLRGEVEVTQVVAALEKGPAGSAGGYSYIGRALREAWRRGRLVERRL